MDDFEPETELNNYIMKSITEYKAKIEAPLLSRITELEAEIASMKEVEEDRLLDARFEGMGQ